MSTVVFDIGQSTKRAASYWRTLRKQGLSRFNIDSDIFLYPLKSLVWSKLVYENNSDVELSQVGDWLADEQALIDGLDIKCPAQLQVELGLSQNPKFEYAHCDDISCEARGKLRDADSLIHDIWPEAHGELRELLHAVAWIKSSVGLRSTSDPKKFGVAHINSQYYAGVNFYELATALVHESAHHALFIESTLDPLLSRDFRKLFYSPIRHEMRPAIGILHSLFASMRILQWGEKLRQSSCHYSQTKEADRITAIYRDNLATAKELLRQSELTEQGIKIINEVSEFRHVFPGSSHG